MEVTPTFLEYLDRLGAWGILTTDAQLIIIGWNRWLERHTGKSAAQTVGRPLIEVYPDLVIRNLDRYYREALEGQSNILSQRFHKYLLPMPPTVPTSSLMNMQQTVRISPMFEGNKIRGTLTLIEDVTERVVTEQELRQQAERLEEANRHKDEFLAMLAHELRNPLAPIRNGIRILDMVASDGDEARETRQMIERQVTHMTRLVDDLLDVSRIIRGKVHLQNEPCDLLAVVRQVGNDYHPIMADNGLDLVADVPAGSCWMNGDAIRLSQIVANLLQNASKFTNEGGHVLLRVRVNASEEFVEVTVSDNGIGMSAETTSRVFDTFSQAEVSLDRSKGGLGLGLALVKGLSELHGGSVEAQSPGIGLGSTFTVRIPFRTTEPKQETAARVEDRSNVQPSKRVLLIEDNRDAARSMKVLIKHLGFEVDMAFTGPEGVDAARRLIPNIVLCDIGLPGLDGFGVARALRSDAATRDAYLIAQSGYGQAEDVRKAYDAGFDLHLIKPVNFSQLQKSLESASRVA